jgi:hypothetical protein
MNIKYLFVLLIAGLMLIAGCSGNNTQKVGESPYIGGNEGVVAEFEPLGNQENGVYTIYDTDNFPIQIKLKNKGEEDVDTGLAKVRIYGIPLSDFSGINGQELTNGENIEKISDVNANGGEVIVNFGDKVKYNPKLTGDFVPLELFASFSYRYRTTASVPQACFKQKIDDNEVCDVDASKTVYSSAGPIQVNAVSEKPAGAGKVSLIFEVENVGGGEAAVPGEEFNTRYDQIQYKIIPDSEAAKWKCTAAGREGIARFSDKKATIICTLVNSLEEGAKYTKEVVLEVDYDYRDVIQESLRVRKSD